MLDSLINYLKQYYNYLNSLNFDLNTIISIGVIIFILSIIILSIKYIFRVLKTNKKAVVNDEMIYDFDFKLRDEEKFAFIFSIMFSILFWCIIFMSILYIFPVALILSTIIAPLVIFHAILPKLLLRYSVKKNKTLYLTSKYKSNRDLAENILKKDIQP